MITRKCRQTGLLVSVASAEELGLDNSGDRWHTICEPHHQVIGHSTKALALSWASDPMTWCEICNGNDTMDEE